MNDAGTMNLAEIRKNYRRSQLRRADLDPDPLVQFHRWMDEAVKMEVIEPTAMGLATVGHDGRPRVRTVLLKGADERGFVFYTNQDSRKGRQLAENPAASLVLPWLLLERQVIVSGAVQKNERGGNGPPISIPARAAASSRPGRPTRAR